MGQCPLLQGLAAARIDAELDLGWCGDGEAINERTAQLMGEIPRGVSVVSESGIAGPEQLRTLEEAGVDAVLVGESLMRSKDPEAALRTLRLP
jgi:indole-3-glycerol phosphate synthase